MQKTISSKLTFFMKFILPLMWFFSLINLINLTHSNSPRLSGMPKEFIVFFWIFGLFIICWFYFKLKKVSIFGDFLCISNFLKEVQIPITEVEKITENIFVNHHPVTIHLKDPSIFGKKIVFMPTMRFFTFFGSHPITNELKQLVRSKRAESDPDYRY